MMEDDINMVAWPLGTQCICLMLRARVCVQWCEQRERESKKKEIGKEL